MKYVIRTLNIKNYHESKHWMLGSKIIKQDILAMSEYSSANLIGLCKVF